MKLIFLVGLFALNINAGGNAPEMQKREMKDGTCTRSSKFDLQLIVDSSASIGEKRFHIMMAGIADMISQFDIAKDKTRVALFKYSSEEIMVREIRLNSYDNAADLKAAIKATEFQMGMTFTATAMEKALAHYETGMRDDGETAKVCIVFTDGNPKSDEEIERVPAASKAWAGIGAKVFAVGIGSQITEEGLEAIAGSDERIVNVANFESFGRKAKSLLVKVCKAIPSSYGGEAFTAGSCDGKENLAVDGTATASSSYQGTYGTSAAWKGFAGPEHNWHSANGMPQSITYELKEKAVVCKITFLPRKINSWKHIPTDCPTNFRIEGSHDGSSFNLLKRVEGNTCKEGQVIKNMVNNCAEYRYYRIVVESVPGRSHGAKYVLLRDIQMFGTMGAKCPSSGIPFDCYEGDGASYRGRKTTTNSGRICQNWAKQSPHKHSRTVQSRTEHPNYDLTSNYCRNPDESAGPWCYTIDSEKRWEYCGIPRCSIV